MWSSRMFWKLFVSYATLNLAATITFVVIVSGWQQDQVIEQIRQRLHDSAALVRSDMLELLPGGRTEQLQSQLRRLGEEIDTRITLVAMDGEVLADSKRASLAEVAEMENHKDRLELVQAAKRGYGASERISPTLGEPMLYVALRADQNGKPAGLVRTALPMTAVRSQVAAVMRLIWFVAALVSLAVVTLTYFVAARVARPISTLTQAAEAIAAGEYQHRIYLQTHDELSTLAKSFNRMSDRLEAREAQLRESNQRLATVLEGMAEGVIALDDREHIVLANGAAGRLLGVPLAETEGRPLLEVVRNHSLHEAITESQTASDGRRMEIELSDDDSRVLSVNATLVSGESSTRSILVLQDITKLRRLESLRQEFVANVSHELKTPLSSIKAYAETLINGAINDQQNNVKFVRQIEEQAERLHQLILDLLSLARIESERQAFDIAAVSVANIVKSCFAEHQAAADSKGVALAMSTEWPDLQVRADEEGTRQILNNLIDNALKYTPEGGEVTVTWHPNDAMPNDAMLNDAMPNDAMPNDAMPNDAMVVIDVRDTGIGIAAKHLPRVFERFYRVDKARSRELGGTGLGLSIVKHLAQSFSGGVDVESRVGEGSVFTVTLPRV